MKANLRLGDILIEYGYITEAQLEEAIQRQKQDRMKRLGEILIEMRALTEEQLLIALGQKLHHEIVDLKSVTIDFEVVSMVPKSVSMKHTMLPILREGRSIIIAINDPMDFYAMEDVKSFIQGHSQFVLCKRAELEKMIRQSYAEMEARKAANVAGESAQIITTNSSIDVESNAEGQDSPIVKLVNTIILKAYSEGVSDIHIEPFESFINIRFRIDGQLIHYMKLEIGLALQISTRIKILAELDIAERRIPQDGNFEAHIGGQDVGIRVSVLPVVYGEKIVLRFLSQSVRLDDAETFGMNQKNFQMISKILQNPHGIIYITGPTGSGKTTTLYMMLQALIEKPINISTIEDPVERHLEGIIQTQVNTKAGLTFAAGLRSLLRQDPDVILIGETRDSETAQISVSAAITGHLVFSTLHTNDAISSVVRLSDMDIKSYLIANSVVGIVAQRLIKKVCPVCKERYALSAAQRAEFPDIDYLYRGTGCSACGDSGYKGRIAVHEILEINRDIREMISNEAPTEQIYNYVREKGEMTFIQDNVYQLMKDGITTVEEYRKHSSFEM